jgi:16S rRNA (cytosine1402-N4)-methyltransferase
VGLGGHSEAILESSTETRVIGLDCDAEALRFASERLARFGERFRGVHEDFREVGRVLEELKEGEPAGVLADLGVSSLQFDSPTRGFSFRFDAPLDMRMDPDGDGETAADLLLRLPEEEIAGIIFKYGEERNSRRIAKWIVENREQGKPIRTTKELADLVARAAGQRGRWQIHPATRTFQALRIAVNQELEGLGRFVETAVDLLKSNGRFVVISFHSLEDRIMKQELRRLSGYCQCDSRQAIAGVCTCGARRVVEILTKRPVTADTIEIDANPRSRSAKLRAARKLIP